VEHIFHGRNGPGEDLMLTTGVYLRPGIASVSNQCSYLAYLCACSLLFMLALHFIGGRGEGDHSIGSKKFAALSMQ
jgi:hypothetical protein